jgi:hypothetical protein
MTLWLVQELKKSQLRQVVNLPDPWIVTAPLRSDANSGTGTAQHVRKTTMIVATVRNLAGYIDGSHCRMNAPSAIAGGQRCRRTERLGIDRNGERNFINQASAPISSCVLSLTLTSTGDLR